MLVFAAFLPVIAARGLGGYHLSEVGQSGLGVGRGELESTEGDGSVIRTCTVDSSLVL